MILYTRKPEGLTMQHTLDLASPRACMYLILIPSINRRAAREPGEAVAGCRPGNPARTRIWNALSLFVHPMLAEMNARHCAAGLGLSAEFPAGLEKKEK